MAMRSASAAAQADGASDGDEPLSFCLVGGCRTETKPAAGRNRDLRLVGSADGRLLRRQGARSASSLGTRTALPGMASRRIRATERLRPGGTISSGQQRAVQETVIDSAKRGDVLVTDGPLSIDAEGACQQPVCVTYRKIVGGPGGQEIDPPGTYRRHLPNS